MAGMVKNSSFRLATALLGLLVIILPFSGLPAGLKTVLSVAFGLLIILFSLADNREGQGASSADSR